MKINGVYYGKKDGVNGFKTANIMIRHLGVIQN